MPQAKLISLKDAPWAFASQRLRDEWQRARDAPSLLRANRLNSVPPAAIKTLAEGNPSEVIKMVTESFGNAIEDIKLRSVPEWAMQQSLLEKLQEGKLEACGVQSSPEQRRELEVLPPHFFIDAKINWNGNKVTNFGATYGVVQVRRRSSATSRASIQDTLGVTNDASTSAPATTPDRGTGCIDGPSGDPQTRFLAPSADHTSTEGQRRRPGPLSGEAAVIAAYNQLSQNGVLKAGMTFKAIRNQLLPILERNSATFPNGRGLSNASIARHLSPYLRSKFSS